MKADFPRTTMIKISRILNKVTSNQSTGYYYAVCFFKAPVKSMKIDGIVHKDVVKNTAIFMKPY